jgi:hypothetical protein
MTWYLRDALTRSDEEVMAAVDEHLATPLAPAGARPEAVAEAQIALCIAESRRLIAWPLPEAPATAA